MVHGQFAPHDQFFEVTGPALGGGRAPNGQRDLDRLALQQAGGVYAGAPGYATVKPEPLTRPARAARPLNPEAQDIVSKATQPAQDGAK